MSGVSARAAERARSVRFERVSGVPDKINPIAYKSSYRLAAEQIRRALELGTYLPGDRLPPSREFAYQLGISVATLREAVRGLIDEGLLEMRRGPKGGLVVLPQPRDVKREAVPKAVLAEVGKVIELRKAVEAEAARLAAERRTEADLRRLQAAYEEMEVAIEGPDDALRAARFNRADAEFHQAIARAARNEVIGEVIEEMRLRMFVELGVALHSLTAGAHRGHDAILREIRRGRPEAAAKAARKHLDVTREDAFRVVSPRRS
jgi:DNA-binding FadR family transcriptional regulator